MFSACLRFGTLPVVLVLVLSQLVSCQPAFSDGPIDPIPANFGNRNATLLVKINPTILTKETAKDASLQLRLYDAVTKAPIKHSSFFIEISKENKLLLRNVFHTHSGNLTLRIVPTPGDVNSVQVFGDPLPQLPEAWTGHNDNVEVHAPVLLDSGLYHLVIKVFGIDYDNQIFAERDVKSFDSWLNVGDVHNQTVSYGGSEYDLGIISYYDKIQNFHFDQSTKSISFSNPFNWDIKRLESLNVFILHQEIRVPKSFAEYASDSYVGNANGLPLVGRMIILDPYSIEGTNILHVFLNKPDILKLAKTVPAGLHTIDFSIMPAASVAQKSFDVQLDSGAKAVVSYGQASCSDPANLQIAFFDPAGNVIRYVRYGYEIRDASGNLVAENVGSGAQKPGVLASEGIDFHAIKFPSSGKYRISLGIFNSGIEELLTWHGIGASTFDLRQTCDTANLGYAIPPWVKSNAKWWSEGKIGDSDFVSGLQYLIKKQIIKVSGAQSGPASKTIPPWVKSNAKWWSEGKIGDSDFVLGIQYLIKQGTIKI